MPLSFHFGEEGKAIFFFNDTATTEIYTLSLHDALPISERRRCVVGEGQAGSVQDHRHQRVIAAQREKLERAVEAEPVAHRGESGIAHAPAGVGLATESVDGSLLGRQT